MMDIRRIFLTLIFVVGLSAALSFEAVADDTSTGQDNSKVDDSKNGIDGMNYQQPPTSFNSPNANGSLSFFNQPYANRTSGLNSTSMYGASAALKFGANSSFGGKLPQIGGSTFPIIMKGAATMNGFGQIAGSLGGTQNWQDHYSNIFSKASANVTAHFGKGGPLVPISNANRNMANLYTTDGNSNKAQPSKYGSTEFKTNKEALSKGMCHMVAAESTDTNAYDVTMKADGTYDVSGGPSEDGGSGSGSSNNSQDKTDSCVNCSERPSNDKKLGNSMKAIPTSLNNMNLWYPLVDAMWQPYESPSYYYANYANDTNNKNAGSGVDDYSYTYVCGKKTFNYALGSTPGKEAWYNGYDYYKHPIQDNDKKGNILASSQTGGANSMNVTTTGKGGNSDGNSSTTNNSSSGNNMTMDFKSVKSGANLSSMLDKAKSSVNGNTMDMNRHTIFNAAFKPCWTAIYAICEATVYGAASGKCAVIATQTCEVQLCRHIILPPVKSVNHLQMTYNLAPKGLNGTTKGKFVSKSDDDLPFGTDQEMAGVTNGKSNYKSSDSNTNSNSPLGGGNNPLSGGGGGGSNPSGKSTPGNSNEPNYTDGPMNIYYAWKALNSNYTGYEMPPIAFPGSGQPASQGVVNKLNGARQPSDLEKMRPWQATVVSNDHLSPKLDNENVQGVHNKGAQYGYKNEFIFHMANCLRKSLNCDCTEKALETGTAFGYLRSRSGGMIPDSSAQQTTEKTIDIPGQSNKYARDNVGTVGRSSAPVSIVPRSISTKLGDYAMPANLETMTANKNIFGNVTGLNNAKAGDWILLNGQDSSSSDSKDSSNDNNISADSNHRVIVDGNNNNSQSTSTDSTKNSNSNKQKRAVAALVERKIGTCLEVSAKGGGLGKTGEPQDSWGVPVGDYDVPAYRTICPPSGPYASAASSATGALGGLAGSMTGSGGGAISGATSSISSALSSLFGGVKLSGFPTLGGGYPSCADSSVSPCDEPDWDKFTVYHAGDDHRSFSKDGSCSGTGC